VVTGGVVSVVPVPIKEITTGTTLRLLEILTVPILEPFPVGANVTLIVHLAPTEIGDEDKQSSVSEKSPVVLIASIRRELLAAFVTVRACGLVPVLTTWIPKLRLLGDEIRAGGSTVTGTLT
jgi:hypothetical protein